MNLPIIDVAVCVVQSSDGRVLVAERTARQVSAGYWELPGGKIEPGETPAQAAARELVEETGLQPTGLTRWITYEHQFPTRRLRLHFFRASGWEGTAHGREGQRLAWVDPHAPHVGPLLASNDRALFALALPPTYLLADYSAKGSPDDFLHRLRGHLLDGARLIRVRLPKVTPGQAATLLTRVSALASDFKRVRILTASAMDSRRAGLAGVHSPARELRRLTARPSVSIWAATCHDQADISHAVSLGADFVVLSPVLTDPEQPQFMAHGWGALGRMAAASPIGIYAQGGLGAAEVPAAVQAGAAGVVVTLYDAGQTSRKYGHANDARQGREMSV